MKIDQDVLLFATRLVQEMGDVATRISRVRLVELTAANNLRAAAFWRDVLHTSERLLAEQGSAQAEQPDGATSKSYLVAGTGSPAHVPPLSREATG